MQSLGALLALCGVVIVVGVVGLDLDAAALFGRVVLGALLVADDEVVDGVGVLAADRADDAAVRHRSRDVTREEGALVLGVGDVQDVLDGRGGRVVDPDPVDIRVFGGDGLDVVELPADADDDIGNVGGVAHLGVMVLVVALDGLDLDIAELAGELVHALLGGVVERTVAERTGHDETDDGLIAGGAVGLAAGAQREHHDEREQKGYNFLHFVTSFT